MDIYDNLNTVIAGRSKASRKSLCNLIFVAIQAFMGCDQRKVMFRPIYKGLETVVPEGPFWPGWFSVIEAVKAISFNTWRV